MRELFKPHIKYMIGDGQDTWLWFDNWMPSGPIHPSMGNRVIYDSGLHRTARVASIIREGRWSWPVANSPYLLRLKEATHHLNPPEGSTRDTIMWIPSPHGEYSTKTAWNAFRDKRSPTTRVSLCGSQEEFLEHLSSYGLQC